MVGRAEKLFCVFFKMGHGWRQHEVRRNSAWMLRTAEQHAATLRSQGQEVRIVPYLTSHHPIV